MTTNSLAELSDAALTSEVARVAAQERRSVAELVAALGEFDARRLYLPAGCSSLYTYCTQVLHLSEHAAYHRIEAARAARRYPVILERLATGDLTLTAVRLLAPSLTPENHGELLAQARHKSKRELEETVARLRPRADLPTTIRKLPAPRSGAKIHQPRGRSETEPPPPQLLTDTLPLPAVQTVSAALARAPIVAPIAPERYKLQLTIARETHDKLRRAQELLRHVVPNGDPAAILDRALTLLVDRLEKRKVGRCDAEGGSGRSARPALDQASRRVGDRRSARSRHIPAAVRRAVWIRDAAQCAFVGHAGRCTERGLSTTIWCHSPTAARPPSRTSSSDAVATISTKPIGGTGEPECSSTLFRERPPAWVCSGVRVQAKARKRAAAHTLATGAPAGQTRESSLPPGGERARCSVRGGLGHAASRGPRRRPRARPRVETGVARSASGRLAPAAGALHSGVARALWARAGEVEGFAPQLTHAANGFA